MFGYLKIALRARRAQGVQRAAYAQRQLRARADGSTIKARERLAEYVGKPITKTDNQSVREWYVANVSRILDQIDSSLHERASKASICAAKSL